MRTWDVQSQRRRRSQMPPIGHIGDATQLIGEVARSSAVQAPVGQNGYLEDDPFGRPEPVKVGQRLTDVVISP